MATLITSWRKHICRWFKKNAWLIFLWPWMAEVHGINQDQLWLPRDYYRHFRALYNAAEMSEQTERCAFVIAGTLSQERSTKDHPVFVVTCRDSERQSFAYIVDGLSMEILNRPPALDPELVRQKELQLMLEKKWLGCFEQLKLRTKGLRATNLTQDMPESTMENENNVRFQVDFNATSKRGYALHYSALCRYEGDKKTIDIHPLINAEDTSSMETAP